MQINFMKREVSCKLVFYGPGMSGKTTNLQIINDKTPDDIKSKLTSIATEGERTLYFDYMPLNLGKVGGMNTKFQLYTVPGQIYYNSTRKLVLQGADGLVFVADSQKKKLEDNLESLQNLEENLKENDIDIRDMPLVIQWNKRDLPDAADLDFLEVNINKYGVPTIEAVAASGKGVIETLKLIAALVLEKLNSRQKATRQSGKIPTTEKNSVQPEKASPQPLDKIVAKINDVNIKESYFNNYSQTMYRLQTKDKIVEDFKKMSKEEKEHYLDMLINNYLLIQESKKNSVSAPKSEIEEHMSRYVARFKTVEEYESYLDRRKLTKENMRNEIGKNILTNKLTKLKIVDFKKKLRCEEEEIKAFYEGHIDLFGGSFEQGREKSKLLLAREKKIQVTNELFNMIRDGYNIKKQPEAL